MAYPNPDAKFTATVEDENWFGESSLYFNSDNFQNLYFIPYNFDHHIAVKIKFDGIGEYQLSDSAAVLVKTLGGDVFNGIYYSFENPDDKVIITTLNEAKGFVEGTFQFILKGNSKIIEANSPKFRAYFILEENSKTIETNSPKFREYFYNKK
jgi:hypothetical protein